MKIKITLTTLIAVLVLAISCEKEAIQSIPEIDDEMMVLVEDEILDDINFAELLDESDDGIFWGDYGFSSLKSAEAVVNECSPEKIVTNEKNKRIVKLIYPGGEGCKSGTIIIEYLKPDDKDQAKKKTVIYEGFVNKRGVEFNGTKQITKGNDNYNIKADITTSVEKEDEKVVTINRNYQRQIHWICGMDTRDLEDNIKKVTGETEVTKTVKTETEEIVKSYTRKILQPLLIVKQCPLRIQAGTVKITKADENVIKIDYGKMAKDVDCDFQIDDCNDTIEVTKDGETFTVTISVDENGTIVRQKEEK